MAEQFLQFPNALKPLYAPKEQSAFTRREGFSKTTIVIAEIGHSVKIELACYTKLMEENAIAPENIAGHSPLPPLQREAYEYEPKQHSADWYWAVGIIATAIAVVSILFSNFVFALFVMLAAVLLSVFAGRPPKIVDFEINEKGIVIDTRLYPYDSLQSFWVEENIRFPKILLMSKKIWMPFITMPLHDELERDAVRQYLGHHLLEVEHVEPLSQKLLEYFGF